MTYVTDRQNNCDSLLLVRHISQSSTTIPTYIPHITKSTTEHFWSQQDLLRRETLHRHHVRQVPSLASSAISEISIRSPIKIIIAWTPFPNLWSLRTNSNVQAQHTTRFFLIFGLPQSILSDLDIKGPAVLLSHSISLPFEHKASTPSVQLRSSSLRASL